MEIGKRIKFFNKFENQLEELHKAGFAFRDFNATKIVPPDGGEIKHNFILTNVGIRLIDLGVSVIKENLPPFINLEEEIKRDLSDLDYVKNVICSL